MSGICAKKSWRRKVLLGVCFIAGGSAAALAADSITGVVRNLTRGRFAAGAEVILLRLNQIGLGQANFGQSSLDQSGLGQVSLNQNWQEETRTKTNSQGAFTIKVRYPDKPHLVRVIHRGVNYDQRASVGDAVSIAVFDAASKAQGVTASIEIVRIGTAGDHLHVSDMIEIRNDSSPPLTQAGERTFEVYLPARAKIDSVLAAGQGTIIALISATPVAGEPGHYAVNFPLQPGATKFAFNYDLPYAGHATFRPRSIYPVQQLAVMIPPTMKFASLSRAFQVLRTGNDRYQVEAANLVSAGEGPGFAISGVGSLPALTAQAQSPPKPQIMAQPIPSHSVAAGSRVRVQGTSALDTVAASGIVARISRVTWWALGAGAVLLGACVFFLWRRQRVSDKAMTHPT
ncbi:MAG TPA: hypothetical protein VIX14_04765 [Terriglobales bacterium]